MLLRQALSKSHKLRRACWSAEVAWYFNLEDNTIEVLGTPITRTLLSVENAIADDWITADSATGDREQAPVLMPAAFSSK